MWSGYLPFPIPHSLNKQYEGIWHAYRLSTQACTPFSALAENHRPGQIASLRLFPSRRCQPVAAPSSSLAPKIDKLRHPQRGRLTPPPPSGATVIRSEVATTRRRPANFISSRTTEKYGTKMGSSPQTPPQAPHYTTTSGGGGRSMSMLVVNPTAQENVRPGHISPPTLPRRQIGLTSRNGQTPRSAGTGFSWDSTLTSASMCTPSSPPPRQARVNSSGSTGSTDRRPLSRRKTSSSSSSSGSVNVHTHCGRHSDQFLFGGWGPLVKGVFHKKD